jgi:hypothetical protein
MSKEEVGKFPLASRSTAYDPSGDLNGAGENKQINVLAGAVEYDFTPKEGSAGPGYCLSSASSGDGRRSAGAQTISSSSTRGTSR